MEEFIFRTATIYDVPFLVETIIEAEKSGSNILSWTTIFGLSESDSKRYLTDMLKEEIDGCELSISSFLVAETKGQVVAALSAWVEGENNESSAFLKGNLLSYVLPKDCIQKASVIQPLLQEIHIDYIPGTIQKGAGYVAKDYRHRDLFRLLTDEIIEKLLKRIPSVTDAYTQIYGSNIAAIKANQKADFKIVMVKESSNEEILRYVPSNKKVLMKKELYK
jgi:hypothetical protein